MAFGLNSASTSEFLSLMVQLHELINEVEGLIKRYEESNSDIALRYFKNIKAAVNQVNFDIPWGTIRDRLDETTLYSLERSAHMLASKCLEKPIEQNELSDLMSKIELLTKDVINSTLPDDVKVLITELLDIIRDAVREYHIRGALSFKKAMETIFGRLHLINEELLHEAEDSELYKRFKEIAAQVYVKLVYAGIPIAIDAIAKKMIGAP